MLEFCGLLYKTEKLYCKIVTYKSDQFAMLRLIGSKDIQKRWWMSHFRIFVFF